MRRRRWWKSAIMLQRVGWFFHKSNRPLASQLTTPLPPTINPLAFVAYDLGFVGLNGTLAYVVNTMARTGIDKPTLTRLKSTQDRVEASMWLRH